MLVTHGCVYLFAFLSDSELMNFWTALLLLFVAGCFHLSHECVMFLLLLPLP